MLPIAAKKPILEIEFLKRGIDPNKAEHGLFLTKNKHDLIHGKGTTGWLHGDPYVHQWAVFFKPPANPTYEETIIFRDQLKAIVTQNFDNADNLPWPIPKTTQ